MVRKSSLEQFHKENIAFAADNLFMEKGIEKTTMDDIAKSAEYSKATLYVYFKSKDEIFYYIVLKSMKMLHEQISHIVGQTEKNALTQYYIVCQTLADFCEQYPFYFESILQSIDTKEESRKQSPVLEKVYQMGELLNGDIGLLIKNGVSQGVFKEDNPSLPTGFIHWAALSGIVLLANKKQDYIQQRMSMSKNEFLSFGFQMMLQTIVKEDVKYEK